MQEKLAITVLVIMLALFALVLVLYNLVKSKGESYNQIVLSHQDYESRTIPYKRGNIIDRNGTYLAISEKVYNLVIDPKQILDTEENYQYLDATLDALVECFGYKRDELQAMIEEKKDSQYVIYAKQLPAEDKEKFETYEKDKNKEYRALPTEEGGNQRITGVWFEEEYKRTYPYNELACNVVGFALKDGNASGGVEQYYNDILNGVSGREYGYLNGDSNVERTVKPAQNGKTLELTIDVNIQKIVQKYLDEWQAGIGSNLAAAIVMDPNSGEILAMDTTTRYNLNDPYNLSTYYTDEEIQAMDEKTKSEAWYKMWRNFCVSDSYEPGSPQKAFTVAGAIEEGAISGNEVFECGGKLHFGDWDIRCVARAGHGPLTITQGLMKSCNVVMMRIVSLEGKEKFVQYQKIFGFGEKTGIDLPGEASGLIYQASNMDPASLATNAFGQNYNCTMVQMVSGFASLINGGTYYQPHLVTKITDSTGNTISTVEPKAVKQTISKSTSDKIRDYLQSVVKEGTGNTAKVDGYSMGGKTGTAQKFPRGNGKYLVSFMGFAPYDNPQVLIYVVVNEPNVADQPHSVFAQNIAREILEEVLPYMNIYPDEETTGLHSGWDITGTDTGAAAVTDRVTGNMENISEEEPEGTDDVPDTMEDIPGAEENNEENAENDGVNAEEAGTTSDNSE